jgi:thioredoxin 1
MRRNKYVLGVLTVLVMVGCKGGAGGLVSEVSESDSLAALPPQVEQASDEDESTSAMSPNVTLASVKSRQQNPTHALVTLRPGEDLDAYLTGSHRGVILDFYADWCGPCREQGKILHEVEPLALAKETLIVKINIDEHPKLAQDRSVSGIPTLVMIREGQETHRRTGVAGAALLSSWME